VRKGRVTGWTPVVPGDSLPPLRPGIALQALGSLAGYHRTHVRHMLSTYTARELTQLGVPVGRMWNLGIPLDAYYFYIPLEAPLGWPDYRLEIDGTLIEAPVPRHATIFLDELDPAHPVRILAWRRRVIVRRTQDWVELRWHPEQGDRAYVHHAAATWPVTEERQARIALDRAWQLLRRIEGRPLRSGAIYPDRDAFLAHLVPVLQQLKSEQVYASQPTVAERLTALHPLRRNPILPRQVQRWFDQFLKSEEVKNWHHFLEQWEFLSF
jgi:hypothetical protein